MEKKTEIVLIISSVIVILVGVFLLITDHTIWVLIKEDTETEDEGVSLVEPIEDAIVTVDYGGGVNVLGRKGHDGIDYTIKSDNETEIKSAGDGYVSAVKENKRYGNYVVISHSDEVETLYAHLKEVTVTNQEDVKQGDRIGIMGSTGMSTGDHVHFEVREQQEENENKVTIDPKEYLE